MEFFVIYFKHRQAKDIKNLGKVFKRTVDKNADGLDDLKKH